MEWVGQFQGQLVALDTGPFIYFIERHPAYVERVRPFFQALDRGELRVVASTVVLLEVMVVPFRSGNLLLLHQYRDILLNTPGLTMLPVSAEIAEGAARLRATHSIAAADAIHLATASLSGATAFLTNDRRFPQLATPRIIMVDDL